MTRWRCLGPARALRRGYDDDYDDTPPKRRKTTKIDARRDKRDEPLLRSKAGQPVTQANTRRVNGLGSYGCTRMEPDDHLRKTLGLMRQKGFPDHDGQHLPMAYFTAGQMDGDEAGIGPLGSGRSWAAEVSCPSAAPHENPAAARPPDATPTMVDLRATITTRAITTSARERTTTVKAGDIGVSKADEEKVRRLHEELKAEVYKRGTTDANSVWRTSWIAQQMTARARGGQGR
ncbi:hypothetical protein MAPG_10490 [Magnaporthiopsis poae ATCC 64411]|uniref:Uncharacterized protein n=1 Tax=Magnaporthiopsis poae (strain ATCC 64411 / 73-15) TaxID=644358 RepID=A0A0C4ECQ8_MAGP6|nr:hypothetical protein MAPG_10490 [Magnaporthiopsis poae ATCC 64411]